jgi:hypothetical protein
MEKGTGISKRRFRIFQVSGGIWRLVMMVVVLVFAVYKLFKI